MDSWLIFGAIKYKSTKINLLQYLASYTKVTWLWQEW